MIPTRRLRRGSGGDRYAIVFVEPSSTQGAWVVRVARGVTPGAFSSGTTYGPFSPDVVAARVEDVVAGLVAEGFSPSVHEEIIEALSSADTGRRARAAIALGWRSERALVPALLSLASSKGPELSSVVEALGRIGDPAGIPIARELAEKKLLSRRRAGVEALRLLGDAEGLALARDAGLKRLPPALQNVLGGLDENDLRKSNIAPFIKALEELEPARLGLALDQLYEAGSPALLATARHVFRHADISAPHMWRYAKSVLKRAMLREDGATFALLALAIERRALVTKGKTASLKSGLDGVTRQTRVFGRKTQRWALRAIARYLRRIAKWRGHRYPAIAAEVLVLYRDADRGPEQTLAKCFVLQRILNAPNSVGARKEAHPELWDAAPAAYLRILVGARLHEALDFALTGVARHPSLEAQLLPSDLAVLLASEHQGVVHLAIAELERRFDEANPDLELLTRLLDSGAAEVRSRGAALLNRSRAAWVNDPELVLRVVDREVPHGRTDVAGIIAHALRDASAETLVAVTRRLIEFLRQGGDDDRLAPVAELLSGYLSAQASNILSSTELVMWLERAGSAALHVAGHLLSTRPEAFSLIGLTRLTALAESEVASVRGAAVALISGNRDELEENLSPLYTLAESRWADVRSAALARLRVMLGREEHGFEALIAVCDSNHPEVRALGRELVMARFDRLDVEQVLFRLIEHPERSMRAFAMDLVERHLPPGAESLGRCQTFFRSVLLDVRASANTKRRVIEFLITRGVLDAEQAAISASTLERVLRTRTVRDFEHVIAGLVAIQTRFPEVRTALRFPNVEEVA